MRISEPVARAVLIADQITREVAADLYGKSLTLTVATTESASKIYASDRIVAALEDLASANCEIAQALRRLADGAAHAAGDLEAFK